jgi:3-oxoacyl-[acyl-carrier-protein] synthase III
MSEVTRSVYIEPRTLLGVQVLGVGSYAPPNVVANEQLAQQGFDAEWIEQRTGIHERRIAPPDMATSDMAIFAARRCLQVANVAPSEVDLLIVATFTGDVSVPATACLVQHRLGVQAPAFDLNNGCAGFMFALVTGMQFVASGCNRRVLVIGADTTSRVADPNDIKTFPLFGDGAGAVLLGPGSAKQGLMSYVLGSDGSGAELLTRPFGGSRGKVTPECVTRGDHYLKMDGRAVFKWAVRIVEDTSRDVLRHAELSVTDLDLVLWHQANTRIMDSAAAALGIERGKLFINLDRYGNTSAASIPLALDEALQAGLIGTGSRVLLSGYGAGLAWGTAVLQL